MKFTLTIIMITSILSSIATIGAYNSFNKNTTIKVLALDEQATFAMKAAKSEFLTALKYNYANMTRKSAITLMNKKQKFKEMERKAGEAIAEKAIQMIESGEADIVIPENNTVMSIESVKVFIH